MEKSDRASFDFNGESLVAGRISTMQYANPGTRGFVTLTRGTLEALDDYIAWAENVSVKKLAEADDFMAMYLAMLSGSYAQKYSAGMKRAPQDSSRSWAMPVPRVTNRYFLSWRVQRVQHGTWLLTNDSREAYFIEYGIHRNPRTGQVAPRRIRRPIFKLSFLRTIEVIQTTAIAHRVWTDILVPKPGEPGRRTRGLVWLSQPSGVMSEIPFISGFHSSGAYLTNPRRRNDFPLFRK